MTENNKSDRQGCSLPFRMENDMTNLQWFAFVYLPLGVCVFGTLLAAVGVKLIKRAGE